MGDWEDERKRGMGQKINDEEKEGRRGEGRHGLERQIIMHRQLNSAHAHFKQGRIHGQYQLS